MRWHASTGLHTDLQDGIAHELVAAAVGGVEVHGAASEAQEQRVAAAGSTHACVRQCTRGRISW